MARLTLWQGVIAALIAGLCGVAGSYLQFVAKQPATAGEIDVKLDRRLPSEVAATFDRRLPIGTIVASVIAPDVFAQLAGDPKTLGSQESVWVPADGRAVDGSAYVEWTKERTVPDLRGLFLRGLNAFQGKEQRADGRQDPDGHGRTAGDYQQDALQQHGHEPKGLILSWGAGPGDLGLTSTGDAHTPAITVTDVTGANVADETRPKNAAVYYYIKVN